MNLKMTKRKLFVLCLAFLLFFVFLPALTEHMTQEEAAAINEQVGKIASNATVTAIFGNNEVISLFLLCPIIGVPFSATVMYNTGKAILAQNPTPLSTLAFALVPIVWLEFFAYTLSLYTSVCITRLMLKRRFRESWDMLKNNMAMVTVALLVGAIFETILLRAALG